MNSDDIVIECFTVIDNASYVSLSQAKQIALELLDNPELSAHRRAVYAALEALAQAVMVSKLAL